jgi:hypothetical protein
LFCLIQKEEIGGGMSQAMNASDPQKKEEEKDAEVTPPTEAEIKPYEIVEHSWG